MEDMDFFGLVAGFGESVTPILPTIRDLKFGSVRTDLQSILDPMQVVARTEEFTGSGIRPLYIVTEAQLPYIPFTQDVEFYNEPDLHMTPEQYAHLWNAHVVPSACYQYGRVFAGSISNLTRSRLRWLRTAWNLMIEKPKYVSIHRYPNELGWWMPHFGFYSRSHEVRSLRSIIGNTPLIVSEFGYHSARRLIAKVIPARWSDRDIYYHVRREWNFWYHQSHVLGGYLYQLNDGPTAAPLDKYGVRRMNMTYKPVAYAHWYL